MPELPEIHCRAQEMTQHLCGRIIRSIEVKQPKCLNVTVEAFSAGLTGATVRGTTYHGKWLQTETTQGHLLINLGMGGELLLVDGESMPEKWRIRIDFHDGMVLAINFWWFGSAHFVGLGTMNEHQPTKSLGPNVMDLSRQQFAALLSERRGRIKPFLLNQAHIAGIGNAYIHDILFRAGIHPLRPIPTLNVHDVNRLFESIGTECQRSIDKGGAQYELGLLGERGGFGASDLLVGYREGKPCPTCGKSIVKLKTGSTTSYVCLHCQPL